MTIDFDQRKASIKPPDPLEDLGGGHVSSVVDMFAQLAARYPEQIAISWEGRQYDYRSIWHWVNALAKNVKPGQRVAVHGRRNPGTIAAIWAVLVAGGVVVPVDETLPPHRRRVMVEQSGATLLISVDGLAVDWVENPIQIMRISASEAPRQGAGEAHQRAGIDRAPAYIFFTSGTSGIPKGVLGTKAGLDQFINWMATTFDIGPGDRIAHTRSISFDASLREIFSPLAVGATMCIAPDPFDPELALSWIEQEGITVLNATPSHAEIWVEARDQAVTTSLRWVMFSGEALNEGFVRRWRSRVDVPGYIVNLYGPTEATMIRTYWVLGQDLEPGVQPVGFPIPHSQALVVSKDGRLCSPGERGEVLLRTSYGTLGYINDPDAQSNAFVSNPFSGDPNDLVYRTGDVGWYREDGSLVVSGRIDDQVQILGLRVEPAEVTAHLSTHPGVAIASVVADVGQDERPTLTAYLVPAGSAPSVATLRKYLAARLPGPAIPARFEFLAEMPLTANGKVDRNRLATAPRSDSTPVEALRLAALSPAKRKLLEMRLGRSPVPVTTAELETPSGLGLSRLSYAQERLWFLDRLHPGRSAYTISRGFRLRGPLDVARLRMALDSIHSRHEILRTRYVEYDGIPYQEIDPVGPAPVSVIDLTDVDPEELEAAATRLVERESQRPFDLSTGPIWRITVAALTPTDHLLVLALHHIASDGWSMPILFSEMASLYQHEGVTDLPKLSKQYADYATEQRRHLETGGFEDDLAYWQNQLAGAPSLLPLPTDRPRSPSRDSKGERHRFNIPAAGAEQLTELARTHRVTPFMVGLALFVGYLERLTGSTDPVVGVPSADRPSIELEGLIGFFVNSLPIRPGVPQEASFRQLLERVRETAIGAYNHRQVPFEHIVNRIQPPRSPDRTPIFHVFFQFGGMFEGKLELKGLEIQQVPRLRTATKFDMTMYLGLANGALAGSVVYATDLFDSATIERICEGFGTFATAALASPDLPIGRLPAGTMTQANAASKHSHPIAFDRTNKSPTAPDLASSRTIDRMCDIWHLLLGGPPVLPDDDFFARGGHSLLAVRIFSRIEKEWGIELPIGALFDAETPRLLSAYVDAARNAKPVLVRRELDRAPLSFAQRRLWFLDWLAPSSSAYHIPWRIALEGELDIEALQVAFDTLSARHSALRTRIVEEDGVPWQVVDPPAPVHIEHEDLRGLTKEQRSGQTEQLVIGHTRRPFELAKDSMFRVLLIRVADQLHVLSVVTHHIASDAESMRIMRNELKAVYEAHRRGDRIELPKLAFEYTDVAAWQAERFADRGEPGLSYWQERLKGELPILNLAVDKLRPARFTHRGATITVRVPEAVTERLLELSGGNSATPFMALLASFAILLHRYTNQTDLIVGIPSTERVVPGTDGLIGFLVNSLPIRLDLSDTPDFLGLMDQVRDRVVEAMENAHVPFEAIVERIDPPRDPSRTPIFQAMFDLGQPSQGKFNLEGLRVVPTGIRISDRIAKFDLRLHCLLRVQRLTATFEYRTDLFDRQSIEAMATQFLQLLESIVARPDIRVDRLDIVPAAEALAHEAANDAARRIYPAEASVADVYFAVAARMPEAVAIESGDRRYTYRELSDLARALADRLAASGVRAGDLVAIRTPRSAGTVVAMLAVLAVGAAYVPFDTNHPTERFQWIAAKAGIKAAISGDSLPERLRIDLIRKDAAVASETTGGGVAYVMYTSGSTGQPKGVVIPHRAILRLVCNTNYIAIGAGDAVAFASNVAFDAATFEVWGALLNGARLVVIEPEILFSPNALARLLKERAVSTLFLTTALFNAVIAENPHAFASLRDLLFGGEAADPSMVRRCLHASPPERLIHVYGPTESTTFATFEVVTAVHNEARTVPIGRPVANTTIRIVDRNLASTATGIPGELLIGGDGLALGYIGDPDLTQSKFVTIDQNRFYRTGDLVRRRPDEAIEFLERLDRQIKMRGFRIEPAEIEARLTDHEAVAEAVVVPQQANGELRLAAFVVPRAGQPLDASTLFSHLERRLPDFMVPASIDFIDRIPLVANGKVDTTSLPAPRSPIGKATSPGPLSDDERRMASIWRTVLGRDQINRDDNFFDLGGHSLLAVKLVARIEEGFGTRPSLAILFEAPTLASLTRRLLEPSPLSEPHTELVPIQPDGDRVPLFCIHPAGGNVLVYADLARHLGRQQPLFGLQAIGVDGLRTPQRSIEEMAAHYESIIRRQCPDGPYLLAGWSSGGVVAYELARRLDVGGSRVGILAMFDTGFPLSGGLASYQRLLRRRNIGAGLVRRVFLDLRHLLGTVRHGIPLYYGLIRGNAAGENHVGWRIWRTARRALAGYTPSSYSGKITYFRAVGSLRSSTRSIARWKNMVGSVDVIDVVGTHDGRTALVREPQVADLASRLRALLDSLPSEGAR